MSLDKMKDDKIHVPIIPRGPQQSILDALSKYRWAVIVAHRRMGKTVIAIVWLILCALTSTKRRPFYGYLCPQLKQARAVAWDYLLYFTKYVPGRKISITDLSVTFGHNGAVIRLFGGDHPDSLRGLYFDGVVVDEPAQMKPDLWDEVIRPALTDRKGFGIFIGTPKGVNKFHELYEIALRDAEWYCGVFPASETGLVGVEELAEVKRTMSDNQYRQEFECDFSASAEDTLISFDLVAEAKVRVVGPQHYHKQPKILGVDVARFGDDSTVIQKRQGVMAFEPVKMYGLDQMEVAARVAKVMDEWNPHAVFIDQGYGVGVIDRLRQLGYKVVEVPFGSNATDKDKFHLKRTEMWFLMKEWLKIGRIPDNKELISDLLSPTYKIRTTTNQIVLEPKESIKERLKRSPDLGDALALTFAHPVRPSLDTGLRSEQRQSGLVRAPERYVKARNPLARARG